MWMTLFIVLCVYKEFSTSMCHRFYLFTFNLAQTFCNFLHLRNEALISQTIHLRMLEWVMNLDIFEWMQSYCNCNTLLVHAVMCWGKPQKFCEVKLCPGRYFKPKSVAHNLQSSLLSGIPCITYILAYYHPHIKQWYSCHIIVNDTGNLRHMVMRWYLAALNW
jgi:hypothetical protein